MFSWANSSLHVLRQIHVKIHLADMQNNIILHLFLTVNKQQMIDMYIRQLLQMGKGKNLKYRIGSYIV